MKILSRVLLALGLLVAATLAHAQDTLRVYNWSDYIAPDAVAAFERETGVTVVYDTYSSSEPVETMLLAGGSGYDVVVIPSEYLPRLVAGGALRPLDHARIASRAGLDPAMMAILRTHDPDNRFALPYLWGVTGIGYDPVKIAARFPEGAADKWALLFDPDRIARLAGCGVGMIDAPEDAVLAALAWLGRDPLRIEAADLADALDLLAAIGPHVSVFDSAMTGALERGEICLALIWSGDALSSAANAGQGVDFAFAGPPRGGSVWFDVLVTPADGENVEAAGRFIDFMLRPEVIAATSNYTWTPNAAPASAPFIDPAIRARSEALFAPGAIGGLALYRAWSAEEKKLIDDRWLAIKLGAAR